MFRRMPLPWLKLCFKAWSDDDSYDVDCRGLYFTVVALVRSLPRRSLLGEFGRALSIWRPVLYSRLRNDKWPSGEERFGCHEMVAAVDALQATYQRHDDGHSSHWNTTRSRVASSNVSSPDTHSVAECAFQDAWHVMKCCTR